jgi:glutaredoxin
LYQIYSKPNCTYCDQAKLLLGANNLQFEELIIDVGQDKDPTKTYVQVSQLKELVPNAKSVPQIFKDGILIGGFTELKESLR